MYRSIANFGIWCTAQLSPPSRSQTIDTTQTAASTQPTTPAKIQITGTIPDFEDHMIRQRVSTHGQVRTLESESEIPALNIPPSEICVIHAGPTKRWLTAKSQWDTKYAKEKRRVQLARGKEYVEAQRKGFLGGDLAGEMPPPSALAGRPSIQMAMAVEDSVEKNGGKNFAGWMWGVMGGMEDKEKEEGKEIRIAGENK